MSASLPGMPRAGLSSHRDHTNTVPQHNSQQSFSAARRQPSTSEGDVAYASWSHVNHMSVVQANTLLQCTEECLHAAILCKNNTLDCKNTALQHTPATHDPDRLLALHVTEVRPEPKCPAAINGLGRPHSGDSPIA